MCMTGVYVSSILIALAVGFIVLAKASKMEGRLKDIGKVIGWLIIVVSGLTLVVSLYCSLVCPGKMRCGYMMGKGIHKKTWMKEHMKEYPMIEKEKKK